MAARWTESNMYSNIGGCWDPNRKGSRWLGSGACSSATFAPGRPPAPGRPLRSPTWPGSPTGGWTCWPRPREWPSASTRTRSTPRCTRGRAGVHHRGRGHRGTFRSVKDLIAAIEAFIDGWNDRCQPFIWTKTAEELLPHCRPGKRTSFTRR